MVSAHRSPLTRLASWALTEQARRASQKARELDRSGTAPSRAACVQSCEEGTGQLCFEPDKKPGADAEAYSQLKLPDLGLLYFTSLLTVAREGR